MSSELANIDGKRLKNIFLCGAFGLASINAMENATEYASKDKTPQTIEIIAGQPQDDINSVKTIAWGAIALASMAGLARKEDENDKTPAMQRFMKNVRNAFNGR